MSFFSTTKDSLSASLFTFKTMLIISLIVALFSIPLNLIDLPINILLFFMISIINVMLLILTGFLNLLLLILFFFATVFQIIMDLIFSLFSALATGLKNLAQNSSNTLVSAVSGSSGTIEITTNTEFHAPDLTSQLKFIDMNALLVRFNWNVSFNLWNDAGGSFVVNQVVSGLPAQGVWQILIVPLFRDFFNRINKSLGSLFRG